MNAYLYVYMYVFWSWYPFTYVYTCLYVFYTQQNNKRKSCEGEASGLRPRSAACARCKTPAGQRNRKRNVSCVVWPCKIFVRISDAHNFVHMHYFHVSILWVVCSCHFERLQVHICLFICFRFEVFTSEVKRRVRPEPHSSLLCRDLSFVLWYDLNRHPGTQTPRRCELCLCVLIDCSSHLHMRTHACAHAMQRKRLWALAKRNWKGLCVFLCPPFWGGGGVSQTCWPP